MSAPSPAPGARQQLLRPIWKKFARAVGHADRAAPTAVLLRRSAASLSAQERRANGRAAGSEGCAARPSVPASFVANAPWSDQALLETVRRYVLRPMERKEPVVAWILDNTGFPKKGTHSVSRTTSMGCIITVRGITTQWSHASSARIRQGLWAVSTSTPMPAAPQPSSSIPSACTRGS